MESLNENLSDEELKKKAYLIGLRLKNSGFDAEVIFAKLEKQGIPEEIARKVIADIAIERKKDAISQAKPFYVIALFRIGLGLLAAAVTAIFFPNNFILPIGLIAGGIISAVIAKRNMK